MEKNLWMVYPDAAPNGMSQTGKIAEVGIEGSSLALFSQCGGGGGLVAV